MRLLGGDPSLPERGARNRRSSRDAPQTEELNHAPLAIRNCFLSFCIELSLSVPLKQFAQTCVLFVGEFEALES